MTDRSHLLKTSPEDEITNYIIDSETLSTRNYGSIQLPPESSQIEEIMDDSKTTLKFIEKIGFSLGHFFNDLCAAIW
jgi:hypothetical protein